MFNSWTINLISTIILSLVLGGSYYVWKNSVEQAAVAQIKIRQLETELKAQQKVINDLTAINEEGNAIISDLKDKQLNLNKKLSNLENYLKNHKDTKGSSEVLKRTFKELAQ